MRSRWLRRLQLFSLRRGESFLDDEQELADIKTFYSCQLRAYLKYVGMDHLPPHQDSWNLARQYLTSINCRHQFHQQVTSCTLLLPSPPFHLPFLLEISKDGRELSKRSAKDQRWERRNKAGMREESVFLNSAVREVKFLQRKTFLECQNKEKITVYDVTTIEKIRNEDRTCGLFRIFPPHAQSKAYLSKRSISSAHSNSVSWSLHRKIQL